GIALVQPPVRRAGALRVDTEQLAFAQHPYTGVHRRTAGRPAGAVDRVLPGGQHEPALEPALEALLGEVLLRGQEVDAPADARGQEERVDIGQDVACDYRTAFYRDAHTADHLDRSE